MEKPKHTAGPWVVANTFAGSVHVSAGTPGAMRGLVAACDAGDYARSREEGQANARLIAAAPELLEACKEALGNSHGLDASVAEALRAALTKVEG